MAQFKEVYLVFLITVDTILFTSTAYKNRHKINERCGFIEFPFNEFYESEYTFEIIHPEKKKISLIFLELIGFIPECDDYYNYSVVKLTSDESISGKKDCFSKKMPHIIQSTTGRITLSVHIGTMSQTGQQRFKAVFTDGSGNICAKNVYPDDLTCVHSPNYPLNYSNDEDCVLLFNKSKEFEMKLVFRDFQVEKYRLFDNCNSDVLEVNESKCANLNNPKQIGTYCGKRMPDPIIVSGNCQSLSLKFKSDSHLGERGFYADIISQGGRDENEHDSNTDLSVDNTDTGTNLRTIRKTESTVTISQTTITVSTTEITDDDRSKTENSGIIVAVILVVLVICLSAILFYWFFVRRLHNKTDIQASMTTILSEVNVALRTDSDNQPSIEQSDRQTYNDHNINLENASTEYDVTDHTRKRTNNNQNICVIYDQCVDGVYNHAGKSNDAAVIQDNVYDHV